MTILYILAAIWLALGGWLTVDGLKQVLPVIRARNDPPLAMASGLLVAVIVGSIWLPVRFFAALLGLRK